MSRGWFRPGLAVTIERASWQPAPVFALLAELGGIDRAEAERTFNQGVGMVAIVAPDAAATAVDLLRERGVPAWVAGSVARPSRTAPRLSLAADASPWSAITWRRVSAAR
jgi:phosphoribosylformylglycinamidine cyclo-ligase